MGKALRCALVGFGKIAAGYDADPKMARFLSYVTHIQILKDHPQFQLLDVIDPDEMARKAALDKWNIPRVWSDISVMEGRDDIDVVILATPPKDRLKMIQAFPNAKAVLTEKPLAQGIEKSAELVSWCSSNNILLQANYWRRSEKRLQELRGVEFKDLLGDVQFGQIIYGNGLHNNGGHVIDMARLLLGEPDSVQAHGDIFADPLSPVRDDVSLSFSLFWAEGVRVTFQPIDFTHYREIGFDIWGTKGRLALMQETQTLTFYPKVDNRGVTGEMEIACDAPQDLGGLNKDAYYRMYDNLAEALLDGGTLCSSGHSALVNEGIIEAALTSQREGGKITSLGRLYA